MATNEAPRPSHLEPSQLGTKEYWDNLYITEITNHSLDPSDEGTIWFDDSSAEDKSVAYLSTAISSQSLLGPDNTKENCSFLDLGTGNGHFLFRLRQGEEDEGEEEAKAEAWGGRMLGVDYSERSIEFAQHIAAEKNFGPTGGGKLVEFRAWDIMTSSPTPILDGAQAYGWDVVLDKGTFDAISLSEEKDAQGRRNCEGYKERVVPLIREGGVFLVTSCNWTEEELRGWFEGGELEVVESLRYTSFAFGGAEGQSVSTICFRRWGAS
ncbi:S-adenosyl-L-methionine-dependent methyltransferase [Calycina marina]|uniref:Protein-lysine N-methyltransferase EFM4 n=1 Tax=Calycina marina TaxID=1763456 RepID=A0A9P8CEU6_9HELO|nr:S-adenosyl-L-methionine-dependent methyltransferase [Calycina marina]